MHNEIGEYFELEITPQAKFALAPNAVALNCARNCLRYVVRAFNIKKINIPFYTCPVIWQSIKKENCDISFYHIDENFMPTIEFEEGDFVLYTNYFGVCASNVKTLAKKYQNLIVDNALAFYMPKYGIASFNSLRKFFGVPDGAFLYSDKLLDEDFERDVSYQRCSHMLMRVDVSAHAAYNDFLLNEGMLFDSNIKKMSKLTKLIFEGVDIQSAKTKRLENFKLLSDALSLKNMLNLKLDEDDVPMAYPFFQEDENLREKLLENKIYTIPYWNPMPQEYLEGKLQKYLIALPIDQRYGADDMKKILDVIN